MTTLEWILIGIICMLLSIIIAIMVFLQRLGKAFFYHDVPKKLEYKSGIGRQVLIDKDELEKRGLL